MKSIDPNEAVILSFLPTKWRWLVRDKNGDLVLFARKPRKKQSRGFWVLQDPKYSDRIELPYRQMFKSIRWSDEEPTNIDKLLKENIKEMMGKQNEK